MNPSWYDLLDVDPDATDAQIRAAWKSAIADLDPTDRKFRVLNQAAEVLLDPERRAAYDATLVESDAPPVDAVEATEPEPDRAPDEPDDVAAVDDASASVTKSETQESGGRPGWATLALGAVAVVLAIVTLVVFVRLDEPAGGSAAANTSGGSGVDAAQQAAEQAIVPLLSYDYRQLEEDAAAARSYLTEDYQADYDQFFAAAVQENAPRTQTVVSDVQVVASGIVRSGEERVDVLLFVNRPTTNKRTPEPIIFKDQVTVQMVNVDGDWLVDGLTTGELAPE